MGFNIGSNCFIDQKSTALYGATLADKVIAVSGVVVTKSFDECGIVIGGNPV